jgi:dsDNA-binding SOS-regulon protein
MRRATTDWALTLLVLAGGLAACDSQPTASVGAGPESRVSPSDFRPRAGEELPALAAAPDGAAGAASDAAANGAEPPRPPIKTMTLAEASGGLGPVAVLAGAEPTASINPGAKPASPPVLVDSLVGQINGKPVYASKFLAPLDQRLRSRAEELNNNREWQREAARIIYDRLLEQIRDELFLAEARASLTPEQRQGLLFFMDNIRENLSSAAGGSQANADEILRAREGLSLEDKVKLERDRALVRNLAQRYVNPLVNVSWRDIRRTYERNYDQFNPPAVAQIRIIMVGVNDAAGQAKVAAELAAGKPFAEVAALDVNRFARSEGGLIERRVLGTYGEAPVFEDESLDKAARSLSPGQTTGPFDLPRQRVKAWMHLDGFVRPEGRSLEEAQLEIYNKLRAQRFDEETRRFFERLLERGSRTNERDMAEKLLAIASERYLILERAAKP